MQKNVSNGDFGQEEQQKPQNPHHSLIMNSADLHIRKKPTPMQIALEEAHAAATRDEVPIGAVITYRNEIIARAGNRTREINDPTAHAEVLAIRMACEALGNERLGDCDLYVTLEPCTMCAAAISFARIRRLYYAVSDPKGGGIEYGARFYAQPTCHHVPDIYTGIGENDARNLLQNFFKEKRK